MGAESKQPGGWLGLNHPSTVTSVMCPCLPDLPPVTHWGPCQGVPAHCSAPGLVSMAVFIQAELLVLLPAVSRSQGALHPPPVVALGDRQVCVSVRTALLTRQSSSWGTDTFSPCVDGKNACSENWVGVGHLALPSLGIYRNWPGACGLLGNTLRGAGNCSQGNPGALCSVVEPSH